MRCDHCSVASICLNLAAVTKEIQIIDTQHYLPSAPQTRVLWIIPRFQYLPSSFCSVSYNKDLLANFFEQGSEPSQSWKGLICVCCATFWEALFCYVPMYFVPLKSFYPCGGSLSFSCCLEKPSQKTWGSSGWEWMLCHAPHRERTLFKAEVSCSYCAVVLSSEATGIGHGWQEEGWLDGSNELIWYGRL